MAVIPEIEYLSGLAKIRISYMNEKYNLKLTWLAERLVVPLIDQPI